MKLFKLAKTFCRDEDGAVTVDWVVLTAAIVGLGIAVLTSVSGGTTSLADKISHVFGADTSMMHWTGHSDDASADAGSESESDRSDQPGAGR